MQKPKTSTYLGSRSRSLALKTYAFVEFRSRASWEDGGKKSKHAEKTRLLGDPAPEVCPCDEGI